MNHFWYALMIRSNIALLVMLRLMSDSACIHDVTLSLFVLVSLSRWVFSGSQESNLESKLCARWMRQAAPTEEESATRASRLMTLQTCWNSTSEICQNPCSLANCLRPSSRSISVRIRTRANWKYEQNLVQTSTYRHTSVRGLCTAIQTSVLF